MSDKDQFTFEDEDDFPEKGLNSAPSDDEQEADSFTMEDDELAPADDDSEQEADLSAAFADGEKEADPFTIEYDDPPTGDDDSEPQADGELFFGLDDEPVPEDNSQTEDVNAMLTEGDESIEKKPKKEKKSGAGGNSRTKGLLLVLLLVIGGAAGAYYFMDLGGSAPVVPTAPPAPAPAKKSVPLPPEPAKPKGTAEKPDTAKPVKVVVPAPPKSAEQVEEKPANQTDKSAQAGQPAKEEAPAPKTASKPVEQQKPQVAGEVEAAKPVEDTKTKTTASVAVPSPAQTPEAVPDAAVSKPAEEPKPVAEEKKVVQSEQDLEKAPARPGVAPKQVADGAFALDAGSYLFESNRDTLIAQIKKLGYEPLVTPVDATLDMTRLRLGTFSKDDVQKALERVRSIEPGAYSAPAGDMYVIYAGTFLRKASVEKLTRRFNNEGIKVYPEPVQVVRTLSRIRFGQFATLADAESVRAAAADSGVKAEVVKSK